MAKRALTAFAAAWALIGSASAHEFVCEKTIDGDIVHEVTHYPTTLHFSVTVTNTHPQDPSTAVAVRDDFLTALGLKIPEVPFTLDVGQSAQFEVSLTVRSQAECLKLARAQACTNTAEDSFQVMFDGGVAQCAARLVCGGEDR